MHLYVIYIDWKDVNVFAIIIRLLVDACAAKEYFEGDDMYPYLLFPSKKKPKKVSFAMDMCLFVSETVIHSTNHKLLLSSLAGEKKKTVKRVGKLDKIESDPK